MPNNDADYDWDIFISYAHADKFPDPRSCWISKFMERLTHEVEGAAGRQLSIYFDATAQRFNEPVRSILDKVRRSRLLLAIGSPNYVGSRWCVDEAMTFHAQHRDPARIFIAELRKLRDENPYPEALSNLLQARFWYRDGSTPMTMGPGEKQYKRLMAKLAAQICQALEELETAGGSGDRQEAEVGRAPGPGSAAPFVAAGPSGIGASPVGPAVSPVGSAAAGSSAPAGKKVLVAFGPEEVWEERESLINYLVGLDIGVVALPDETPRGAAALDACIADALGEAGLYVQLLGRRKGRPLEGGAETATERQWAAAESRLASGDLFLWRPADIEPELNPDESYKPLLRRAGNWSIPELAKAIRDRLLAQIREAERPEVPDDVPVLLINADPEDEEVADRLLDACRGRRCQAMLDNCELNDERRRQWADATAVAFVHGRADRGGLMARFRIFQRERASSGTSNELKRQAIVYGPPAPKRTGAIVARRLDDIDISTDPTVVPFERWLDKIGAHVEAD